MARFIPEANRGVSRLEKEQAQVDILLLQQKHENMSSGKNLISDLDREVVGAVRRQAARNVQAQPE